MTRTTWSRSGARRLRPGCSAPSAVEGLNFITRDERPVERRWRTRPSMSARRSWPQPALVGVVHLDLAGRRAPLPQQWEKMAAMSVICITGSSDGIGLATARVLVADGHRVLIHARSRDRGRPVLEQLGGETTLVTGNLARLDEVHGLADQIRANGPVDALVHNAGVWVRGNTPRATADGLETTFAVNVLAPHLLTTCWRRTCRVACFGSARAPRASADRPCHTGPASRSRARRIPTAKPVMSP